MNLKIKFRESFRPFAPAVLRERASEWFDLKPEHESPYMLLVAPVLEDRRVRRRRRRPAGHGARSRPAAAGQRGPLRDPRRDPRRLQCPDPDRRRAIATPASTGLLEAFDRLTGCPVLVNTSFNVRGEPIVCTPEDAYRCFLATEMDVLVMEDVVIVKDAAAREAGLGAREAYLAQFQLD